MTRQEFARRPKEQQAIDIMTDRPDLVSGIHMRADPKPMADFHTKLVQAASTGHFPDIAAIDNADVPVFASQGALADMSKYLDGWDQRGQYLQAVVDSTKFNGKSYGIPFRSNTTALWYNQSIFSDGGITTPPATWDELRATAKKLTTAKHSGICFSAAPTDEGTFTFLPMLWQAGGDVQTLGDDASVKALNYVKDLVVTDQSFRSLLRQSPDIQLKILEALAERVEPAVA